MTSKDIYMPYFYIIQHKETKKKYAGSRYAMGCHPNEFMIKDGYTTSSSTIKLIIEQEGIDIFEIIELISLDELCIPFGIQNVYTYETWFLTFNDCAKSNEWYNKHNNNRQPSYGTVEFTNMMINKYGVDHNTKIPGLIDKMISTRSRTYDHNPDKQEARKSSARSVADKKIKNGTTGKGIPKSLEHKNSISVSKKGTVFSKEHCDIISKRQKEHSIFVTNNPMNDLEKRKLVGLSKLGKKAYINPSISKNRKMFIPGNEPEGYILISLYKEMELRKCQF
jgi:hypothetical protein